MEGESTHYLKELVKVMENMLEEIGQIPVQLQDISNKLNQLEDNATDPRNIEDELKNINEHLGALVDK